MSSKSNCKVLNLNLIGNSSDCIDDSHEKGGSKPYPNYLQSDWIGTLYFLQTLQCLAGLDKSKTRSFKLEEIKYFLMDNHLYWKDPTTILLKCVYVDE